MKDVMLVAESNSLISSVEACAVLLGFVSSRNGNNIQLRRIDHYILIEQDDNLRLHCDPKEMRNYVSFLGSDEVFFYMTRFDNVGMFEDLLSTLNNHLQIVVDNDHGLIADCKQLLDRIQSDPFWDWTTSSGLALPS